MSGNALGPELPQPYKDEVMPRVADAERAIFKVVNVMNPQGGHELAWRLAQEHRTLQQTLMRDVILPFVWHMADAYDEDRWDARNEGACLLAKRIATMYRLDPTGLPMV